MRREEFKMERTGLLEIGDVLPITEGKLPNSTEHFTAVVADNNLCKASYQWGK